MQYCHGGLDTMNSFKITDIRAREIIDCRGWPTVQADVWVEGKLMGRADVASGRSTGSHEAYVLLDGDKKRYKGLGVTWRSPERRQPCVVSPCIDI
jgi:enolase